MSKPFAVFDIDGTLIRWQLYHAVADSLARRGHIDPKIYQDMRDARMNWKKRAGGTFKDYELQVIEVYESTIKSLKKSELELAMDAAFEEYKDQVYTYTRNLISELLAKDYALLAISGSPTEMVARIAKHYGFIDYIGSDYEFEGDHFIRRLNIGARNKDISLQKLIARNNLVFSGSLAVGDSHSDIAMLELVENPIAFNPELELFEHAKNKGWKVVIERKNVVYQLEVSNGSYLLA